MPNKKTFKFTKFYTMSVIRADEYLKNAYNSEKVLLISVGNSRIPHIKQQDDVNYMEDFMELVFPIQDLPRTKKEEKLFLNNELTIIKLKMIDEAIKSYNWDTVIIRCDAGASRSQAISTALHRAYGYDFEGNILTGNIDLLKTAEKVYNIERTSEQYENLFDAKKLALDKFVKKNKDIFQGE